MTATRDQAAGTTRSGAAETLALVGVETHADLLQAAELYRRVFGYRTPGLDLNTNLLSALVRNGGSAVGVRTTAGELVGFAYGFAATDGRHCYHYSQTVVVDERHQNHGVGRMLKLGQRDVALRWGQRTMRWAFDPGLTRNGHFNLVSLGATGIDFVPDFYARRATDRVVVEWVLEDRIDLHSARRRSDPPLVLRTAEPAVPVPDDASGGSWVRVSDDAGETERERLRATLTDLFSRGHVLVACARVDGRGSAYLAVPRVPGEGDR